MYSSNFSFYQHNGIFNHKHFYNPVHKKAKVKTMHFVGMTVSAHQYLVSQNDFGISVDRREWQWLERFTENVLIWGIIVGPGAEDISEWEEAISSITGKCFMISRLDPLHLATFKWSTKVLRLIEELAGEQKTTNCAKFNKMFSIASSNWNKVFNV